MVYWIDSGVLIQAARGTYGFKMIPQFWQFIHAQLIAATIQMPRLAYEEILAERKALRAKISETRAFLGRLRGGDRPSPTEVLWHWENLATQEQTDEANTTGGGGVQEAQPRGELCPSPPAHEEGETG